MQHANAELSLLLLFAWSFAASTILPLSSEVPLVVVARSQNAWIVPVAIATAGNFLGACTTYLLARAIRNRVGSAAAPRAERASRWVSRYGQPVLLLSWVPLIGDAIVAAAGAARMPFMAFSTWTLLGKAVRYGAVAWLALSV